MPSLNFTVFLDKVANGTKPHTIRALRKVPIKAGDDLSFFNGMRTKACRRLRANTECTAAVLISIDSDDRYVLIGEGSRFYRSGVLKPAEIDALARRDGFSSARHFFAFFARGKGGDVFQGQLIEWIP